MMKQLTLVLGAAMLLVLVQPMKGALWPQSYPPCWTSWYNRDNSSGSGDIELLSDLRDEHPGEICPKPVTIEVETVDGVPAKKTGQKFHVYSNLKGFVCLNDEQKSGFCLDYKVRFKCECHSKERLYCCE